MAGKIQTSDVSLYLGEQAAAQADVAGQGQIWVKDSAPNELWFTDDAGTDVQLGTGGGYVDRGDPSDWDFELEDLTADETWYDLDLSSIVPAGASAVHLHVAVMDDLLNKAIQFRKNGNSNAKNVCIVRTVVANQNATNDIIVSCDSSQVIEYWLSNTTWTQVFIIVKGWWI